MHSHILYMYVFKIQCIQHTHTHIIYVGNETKKKGFEKKKVFKEDLKELTEVA